MGLQTAPAYLGSGNFNHPANLDRDIIRRMSGKKIGVFDTGDFVVAPTTGLNVTISAGAASILGTDSPASQGHYYAWSDASETKACVAAPGSNSRWDVLVLRTVDAAYSGGYTQGAIWEWISGTVAASPTVPTDSDINTAGNYKPGSWLRIANVKIAAGDTVVNPANITDTRTWTTNANGLIYCASAATRPTTNIAPGDRVLQLDTGAIYQRVGSIWVPCDGSLVCDVKSVATQTVGTGDTAMTFDTENDDVFGMHSGSGSNITVPVAGRYWMVGMVQTGAQTAGAFDVKLRKNGTAEYEFRLSSGTGSNNKCTIAGEFECAASDNLTLAAASTGGSSTTLASLVRAVVRYVGPSL